MSKPKKQGKCRYFVTAPTGEGRDNYWTNNVFDSTSLSDALKELMRERVRRGYEGREVLAREIGYEIVPNEETLSVKVVSVNDIDNGLPYYLIERFSREYETYGGVFRGPCHRTTEYKEWKDLRENLLSGRTDAILTKGIEAKLED